MQGLLGRYGNRTRIAQVPRYSPFLLPYIPYINIKVAIPDRLFQGRPAEGVWFAWRAHHGSRSCWRCRIRTKTHGYKNVAWCFLRMFCYKVCDFFTSRGTQVRIPPSLDVIRTKRQSVSSFKMLLNCLIISPCNRKLVYFTQFCIDVAFVDWKRSGQLGLSKRATYC